VISLSAVTVGLSAALRLARGRPDGVALVADDAGTTVASFWAVAFCIPSVVCRVLMSWVGTSVPADGGHEIARELIIFVLGWLIFVEATYWIARSMGLPHRWRRFIVVWNWCNVIEGVLVIAGGIPGLLGVPGTIDEACQLITLGWALWLEWYATRLALGVAGFTAFGLVLLDQAIGIVLGSIAIWISP
jgi:hypothetical protein